MALERNLSQVQLAGRFIVFGQAADVVRALPVNPVTLAPTGGVLPVLSNIERARNGGAHYFAAVAERHHGLRQDR